VILDRLLYNAASETITTLTSYLDLVRQADATFRRLRPNYSLTGIKSNTQEPLAPLILLLSLPPVVSLIISNSGDAIVGTASRVPRVTLALACSEGLYTLSHPVASSLIYIQYQPEHYIYL
jgi:hypothetical protein